MSRKIPEAHRRAFLKALSETGNLSLAAERAKVSRSWVRLHRAGDPAFDADCRAALAEAKESLILGPGSGPGHSGSNKPPSGWGYLDGEELVVRGGNGRRTQVARARLKQWTPRIEDRFLAVLAATCNVKAACAAVSMTVAGAYAHRRRWPGFAKRWDAAILAGYEFINAGMTAAVIRRFDPHLAEDMDAPPPPEPAVVALGIGDAIRLVRLHEKRAREAALRRMGWPEAGPAWPGQARE